MYNNLNLTTWMWIYAEIDLPYDLSQGFQGRLSIPEGRLTYPSPRKLRDRRLGWGTRIRPRSQPHDIQTVVYQNNEKQRHIIAICRGWLICMSEDFYLRGNDMLVVSSSLGTDGERLQVWLSVQKCRRDGDSETGLLWNALWSCEARKKIKNGKEKCEIKNGQMYK